MKTRWKRFWQHVLALQGQRSAGARAVGWHMMESGILLADCLFVPDILAGLNRLVKPNTRRLSPRELALARSVFGDAIQYKNVRIDERSFIGCRQHRFAYVGFQVINCWGALSDPHFIHEMVHVWQYQQVGSVYIPRALRAQRTQAGYNYGGADALRRAAAAGLTWFDFNYEQQGDIVSDYFCLKYGYRPRWCLPDPTYVAVFEQLLPFNS